MDGLQIPYAISWVGDWLLWLAALFSPFGTDSRFHWTGLAAFFVLGGAVYLWQLRRSPMDAPQGETSLLRFLFPPSLYRTASSWVDVKVYFAGRVVAPLIAAIMVPFKALIAVTIAVAVAGGEIAAKSGEAGAFSIIIASLIVALVNDFSYYVVHRLSHESVLLWPFHKLHHSAEVLTPITAKRNHPVFDLLRELIGAVMLAPIYGIVFGLFGIIDFATIFGVGVLIALMNVMGGALRHSHIWLDFGPVMDRIFISPAQHQIHHSLAPEHHDKNYGLTLAIWDWMFGTLYIPEGREELAFGVADRSGVREPQVHHTLKDAYLVPFAEAAEASRQPSKTALKEHA